MEFCEILKQQRHEVGENNAVKKEVIRYIKDNEALVGDTMNKIVS